MIERVAQEIRRIAEDKMLPRFGHLEAAEVETKAPGEIVTLVDREVELALAAVLTALRPGACVVGEEAAAVTPSLLDNLDQDEVWLVDPLDGTANFAAGDSCFAVMVALLNRGECVASWMYSPVSRAMHIAERGGGAWRNGVRARVSTAPSVRQKVRGAVLTRFLPDETKSRVEAARGTFGELLPGLKCAGEEYPRIVAGAQDFALFWRSLPWDHAPGALYIEEAGGRIARPDGTPYRPAAGGEGLLAARSDAIWDEVRQALLG